MKKTITITMTTALIMGIMLSGCSTKKNKTKETAKTTGPIVTETSPQEETVQKEEKREEKTEKVKEEMKGAKREEKTEKPVAPKENKTSAPKTNNTVRTSPTNPTKITTKSPANKGSNTNTTNKKPTNTNKKPSGKKPPQKEETIHDLEEKEMWEVTGWYKDENGVKHRYYKTVKGVTAAKALADKVKADWERKGYDYALRYATVD
ncbi:hypothetical protein [Eggerthia catenaformis]